MRRYLHEQQAIAWRDAIGEAIAARRDAWGVHGWGFVGRSPKIRVAVRVERRMLTPKTPIDRLTFTVDGEAVTIKQMVEASHAHTPAAADGEEGEP